MKRRWELYTLLTMIAIVTSVMIAIGKLLFLG